MKPKLDENLGTRGHEVATVRKQDLCSATDRALIGLCQTERRCLVTLDLDFGNPLLFRPSAHGGIAVLRLPPKPTPDDLLDGIRTLIVGLARKDIERQLWIVQRGRIREYEQGAETEQQ